MKKSCSEAAILSGDNPSAWDSLAFDDQISTINKYLTHLRESRNTSIAGNLKLDKDTVCELLKNKVKRFGKKGKGRDSNTAKCYVAASQARNN